MGSLPINNVRLTDDSLINSIYNTPVDAPGAITSQLQSINGLLTNRQTVMNTNIDNLNNVASAQNTMYTISFLESQRLNAKKQNVDQALQGQNRMIALNDSYVKRYAKYNQIILVIVLVILIILGAILLPKYVPVIPSFVSDLIIAIAVSIGIIVVYILYMAIQARDKLYFDKLNMSSPDIKDLSDNKLNQNDQNAAMGNIYGCIGSDCCKDPAKYINGKCVNPPYQIYNYETDQYKTCVGMDAMACPAPTAATPDTATQTAAKTWIFDDTNSVWKNVQLNKYWNLTTNMAVPMSELAQQPDAPVVQSFTGSMIAEPLSSSETSEYSFYR